MNRKITWKAMGLGLVVLMAAGAAWAGGPGRGLGPCGQGKGPGMGPGNVSGGPGAGLGLRGLERLGLDEVQQKQIEALRAEHLARVEPVRVKLDGLRAELQALWQAERPDRGALLAKQADMEIQRQALREARVDLRLEVLRLLTPEQRARAAEFMKDRPGRGKSGHGRHGRGTGPGR
jgi:Spy/CpxP family protein refolding chaperone